MRSVLIMMVILMAVIVILSSRDISRPNAGDYVLNKCDGLDEVMIETPENLTAWEICLNEALEEYKGKYGNP